MEKLNILVLARLNQPVYTFITDFIVELGKHARVQVWSKDGWEISYILKILKKRNFNPDFILHYDFAYDYAHCPRVYGLSYTRIPKGVYYFDLQTQTQERRKFVKDNGINLVFSPTKDFFLRMLPDLKDRFRWLPFSINPAIFKDWKQPKDIDFLLMGRMWKDWYPFRNKVLEKMGGEKGFVYHRHPFSVRPGEDEVFTKEKYAREINRAKIFLTCGTIFSYPTAKYYEIPACNTLLMAKGNKDLKELGFINGETFVECDDENFYDLAKYYLKNEEERLRIAKNGYNLVHSRHTDSVRAEEFLRIASSYLGRREKA